MSLSLGRYQGPQHTVLWESGVLWLHNRLAVVVVEVNDFLALLL
jgi:hypothetical protein